MRFGRRTVQQRCKMAKATKAAGAAAAEINPGLTLRRAVSSLVLDPHNARKHPARSIDGIAASLKAHGQQKPIVVVGDTVIAGNGTLMAARQLEWSEIAVVEFQDAERARAYALADNHTADLSEWDLPVLHQQLEELAGADMLPLSVFTEDELMKIAGQAQEEVELSARGAMEKPPRVEGEAAAGLDVNPGSHVRMVQLFLSEEEHPRIMAIIKKLAVAYEATTITETVVRAIDDAAKKMAV